MVDPELADVMAAAVNSRLDQKRKKVLRPGREDGSREGDAAARGGGGVGRRRGKGSARWWLGRGLVAATGV